MHFWDPANIVTDMDLEESKPDFYINTTKTSHIGQNYQSDYTYYDQNVLDIQYFKQQQQQTQSSADQWSAEQIQIQPSYKSFDQTYDDTFCSTSPFDTKTTLSPLGLHNESQIPEQSYDLYINDHTEFQPIKYSQDYSQNRFEDETNALCNQYNVLISTPQSSIIDDFDENECVSPKKVLINDGLINGFAPLSPFIDTIDDTNLDTVKPISINLLQSELCQTLFNDQRYLFGECNNNNNNNNSPPIYLTPAPSPKTPKSASVTDDLQTIKIECEPTEDFSHQEHNYFTNNSITGRTPNNTSNRDNKKLSGIRKRIHNMRTKKQKRVPPLTIRIPNLNRSESITGSIEPILPTQSINTPDISNIFAVEPDKFDLIDYINSSQDKPVDDLVGQTADTKEAYIDLTNILVPVYPPPPAIPTIRPPIVPVSPKPPIDIPAIISSIFDHSPAPAAKRRKLSSVYFDDNTDSRHSIESTNTGYSDDTYSTPSTPATGDSTKRRGRPPKTECQPLSAAELSRLSDSDIKYWEMRHKNNEASRRSRLSRRDRERTAERKLQDLEDNNARLSESVKEAERIEKIWRRANLMLAKLGTE